MVSLLDHSDLQCPDGHGQLLPLDDAWPRYGCAECGWFITRIEFLRNSHGTPEQRRARVANREIGRPLASLSQ